MSRSKYINKNSPPYRNGYEHAEKQIKREKSPDINSLAQAVKDCEAMGWQSLRVYFLGQIDAVLESNRSFQEK